MTRKKNFLARFVFQKFFSLPMAVLSVFICLWTMWAFLGTVTHGSAGDGDTKFRFCAEECQRTGCLNSTCFSNCREIVRTDGLQNVSSYVALLGLQLLDWRMWDCVSECEYQCMIQRESERQLEGLQPVQYHGKWPFKRFFKLQEPASVVFSIGNLAMHLVGLVSFLDLISSKLPQRIQGKKSPYYEYSTLWILYGILSINSWLWSAIFHSRDVLITERMDYLSAVVIIGYTLIVAIIRTLDLRFVAVQMMAAVPIALFVCGHVMYLNFYKFDYGLNMKVCIGMGVIQLLLWTLWGWFTQHPGRYKLWFVVIASALGMLLEIFDFPPIWDIFDAHSIWHAVTIPLTHIWWSFIKDDVIFRTNYLMNIPNGVDGCKMS